MTALVGKVEPSGDDRPWFDASADRLVLAAVRPETSDVKTFVFRASSGARFRFLPGQAMTLALPVGAETLYRSFTIASSPTEADALRFTVKAGPGGRATRWMHEGLRVGDTLAAIGPVGRFSLARYPAQKVLLASAGSGITPMMSMLRWLADRGEQTDVRFLHVARTPADLLFTDELAALDRAMPKLGVVLAVSGVPEGQSWFGYRGRIDRRMLAVAVPDLSDRESFACGPPGFMEAMERIHAAEGGSPDRFHTETFHPLGPPQPVLTPEVVAAESGAPAGPSVRFAGRPLAAISGETILSTAARNGVSIATGCRSGVCGTCRLRLVEGRVDMRHQGGLTPREERAGIVLACCSTPVGEVAVEPLR